MFWGVLVLLFEPEEVTFPLASINLMGLPMWPLAQVVEISFIVGFWGASRKEGGQRFGVRYPLLNLCLANMKGKILRKRRFS